MITCVSTASNFTTGSPSSSISTSATSHRAGNLLVAVISRQSATAETLSDTAGNTWYQAGTTVSSGGSGLNKMGVYYAYNITGHASNVVTSSGGSANYRVLVVYEFMGCFGSSTPFTGWNTATGSGTTASTSIANGDGAYTLGVAIAENDSGSSWTPGQSFNKYQTWTSWTLSTFGQSPPYFASMYGTTYGNMTASATSGSAAWGIAAAFFTEPITSYPIFHNNSSAYVTIDSMSPSGEYGGVSGARYNIFGASDSGIEGYGNFLWADTGGQTQSINFRTAKPVSLSAVKFFFQGDTASLSIRGCKSFTFKHYSDSGYTSLVNSWTFNSPVHMTYNKLNVDVTQGQYFVLEVVRPDAFTGYGTRLKVSFNSGLASLIGIPAGASTNKRTLCVPYKNNKFVRLL